MKNARKLAATAAVIAAFAAPAAFADTASSSAGNGSLWDTLSNALGASVGLQASSSNSGTYNGGSVSGSNNGDGGTVTAPSGSYDNSHSVSGIIDLSSILNNIGTGMSSGSGGSAGSGSTTVGNASGSNNNGDSGALSLFSLFNH